MKEAFSETIKLINNFIQKLPWCDFEILEYQGANLKIVGSTDFTYFHQIEITFKEVFFVQCVFEWKTNTDRDVYIIPAEEEERQINIQYRISQGYQLIKIISEENQCYYISAKDVSVNFEKVTYIFNEI